MFYSGIGDEAGDALAQQIEATRRLGWEHIELRFVDKKPVHDLDEAAFDRAAGMLADAGIQVNCLGSSVANWQFEPLSERDWQTNLEMLSRALPRMRKLNCVKLRGMSFKMQCAKSPRDREVEKAVFAKVRHLVQVCADHGVTYLHENCMNYGGQSYDHTLRLVEAVDMPNFKLLFDTCNPVCTDFRIGSKPYRKQDPLEFFRQVREFIVHVHIKDGVFIAEQPGETFPKAEYTFPGEGNARIGEILKELFSGGYDGGLTIEPHMVSVFHDRNKAPNEAEKLANYCEYGTRLMKLVEKISKKGK